MKLYVARIKDVLPCHLKILTPERAEKAERYKKPDDQSRCIAGGVLLRKFLGDTEIFENKFGKPFAENGTCFNLSHSGEYVLLGIDDAEIGCDIERIKWVNSERVGRLVFCENEIRFLRSHADKLGAFFTLWTKKESLLKCMGRGFHRGAKSVDVSGDVFAEDRKIYYMKTFAFADYVISVCSEKNDFPKTVEFVDLGAIRP